MLKGILFSKLSSCVYAFAFILLISILGYSQDIREKSYSSSKNIHLSLYGGYAHSLSVGGMADLNLEVQFSLASHLRAGLGIGYMHGTDEMYTPESFRGMFPGMMGGMMGGGQSDMAVGFSAHEHRVRVLPITLSLYYSLPINSKVDIFAKAGGGYYIGSYRDQNDQNKSTFGPHFGLGADIKLTHSFGILLDGTYRFATLKGFQGELHEGFLTDGGMEQQEGFWYYDHHEAQWHFHDLHDGFDQMIGDVPPFDINLSGLAFRVGVRLSF